MRGVTMNFQRYSIRMRYLDSGNSTNFTRPYAPAGSPGDGGSSKANAFSPAVVAVIGVLAGAFLIVSYYRIFLRYCNRHQFTFWGTSSDGRNGRPGSPIVLMEEHACPAESPGLDESLIRRIPTCKYKPEEGLVDGAECSVCLGEFAEGEELRILPKCNHPFHIPCIDKWLAASATCPLCRMNIVVAASHPLVTPLEREPPTSATLSCTTPASNPEHHEIEILYDAQEFLESGLLSGPSCSRVSSRSSSISDVGQALDVHRQGDHSMGGSMSKHDVRHFSLETDSSTTTREIHVVEEVQVQGVESRRVTTPCVTTKRRLYSQGRRHRSEGGSRGGDRKGKHPLLPLSSPKRAKTKRFARLMGSGSSASTGSSSLNQVVVELLAQEIFQNNVNTTSNLSDVTATGPTRSVESSSGGSVRRPPKVRHDNASFEVMWSIDEQEDPLMAGPFSNSFHSRESSSDSGVMMEVYDSAEDFPDSVALSSDPNSDCDVEEDRTLRSVSSLKRRLTKCADSYEPTWPSKRHSFRDSMASLSKRYNGLVNLRQNSFRRTEKVHASEPEFEIFDFG